MWFVEWWRFMLSSFWIWLGSVFLVATVCAIFGGVLTAIVQPITSKKTETPAQKSEN
ncbi:MAG: hypothetical protein FWE40_05325 [Oscillospiraceae bacterium]|nr:hypothetical protein [Oscillospiraceae bacterium]